MKKENGNQMPCLKDEMWKRLGETWYSIALTVLEELSNSMPRRIADRIKQWESCNEYCQHDGGDRYVILFLLESI